MLKHRSVACASELGRQLIATYDEIASPTATAAAPPLSIDAACAMCDVVASLGDAMRLAEGTQEEGDAKQSYLKTALSFVRKRRFGGQGGSSSSTGGVDGLHLTVRDELALDRCIERLSGALAVALMAADEFANAERRECRE
jgi:hypothetical protein